MRKKVDIDSRTLSELEKIARLVFPMEMEAMLPVIEMCNRRFLMDIVLPSEYGTEKMYKYSDTFEQLIRCLKSNRFPDFQIGEFVQEREEAKHLFQKYKECQRRRSNAECDLESIDLIECSKRECGTKGQPIRRYMYDFDNEKPYFVWHCHVSSGYGNVDQLTKPSDYDTNVLFRKIAFRNQPIVGELITCTSEKGEQLTKAFAIPKQGSYKRRGYGHQKWQKKNQKQLI